MDRADIRNRAITITGWDANRLTDDNAYDDFINDGIYMVAGMYKWSWLQTRLTKTLTAATAEYDISTDWSISNFMAMDQLTLVGESDGRLERMSYDDYRRFYGDDARTAPKPTHFYMRGEDTVGFYPTPSVTLTNGLLVDYYRMPTTLSSDAGTPEWSALFHHVLVDYLAYRIFMSLDYHQEAAGSLQEFVRGVNEMKDFYDRQASNDTFIFGDGIGRAKLSKRALETFNLPFD